MATVRRSGQPLLTIVALTPLWLALLPFLSTSMFGGGIGSGTVNLVGIPAGIVFMIAAGILTLAGLWAVRSWTRPWAGLVLFTIPATLIVVFAPAVILILENLGNG